MTTSPNDSELFYFSRGEDHYAVRFFPVIGNCVLSKSLKAPIESWPGDLAVGLAESSAEAVRNAEAYVDGRESSMKAIGPLNEAFLKSTRHRSGER